MEQQLVGARIRSARHAAGITSAELADTLGVSTADVDAIEHGARRIDGGEAVTIADTLGTSARALLGITPRVTIQHIRVCRPQH